jgi:hypothetical protein
MIAFGLSLHLSVMLNAAADWLRCMDFESCAEISHSRHPHNGGAGRAPELTKKRFDHENASASPVKL